MEPAPKLWIYRNFFLIRCSRDLTWKIGTSKFYLIKISNWGHPYSWANKEKSEVKKKRKEKERKGTEIPTDRHTCHVLRAHSRDQRSCMKECRSSDLAGNQDLPWKNDWSKLQVIGPCKSLRTIRGEMERGKHNILPLFLHTLWACIP